MLNKLMKQALAAVPTLPEWQDEPYLKATGWPSFNQALKLAHHPVKLTDLEPSDLARSRLAYDELLANQLALAIVRERVKKQQGREINGNGLLRKKVLDALPFKLTSAQEKVLREIAADQASKFRMLRLLQGDVGSGKTIVALLTMLNAVECGTQAAIMAPTEILAKQHLETIQPLCDEIGVRAELLTGRVKGKARTQILEALAAGEIDILIGTHALFVEDVVFKDLACVIVDEQHRFGVHQRLALSNKGNKADILVMTATPIPRSLVLTAYGDMEYSKIDQVPEGRKPVDTRVMPVTKLDVVVAALQRKLTEGCRAYWVCPLVEESEKIDLAAAEERFSTLQQIFGNKVGLVHGKMKEKEKDEVMERFKSGAISLLVATTVIEVGVNVPEATVMVIEHAERFGLAQLHQLRGRIKRGFQASTCILLYSYPLSETSRQRLNTMRETEDGFEIAEKDLELRGGGEILGTRQSGFNEFRLADMNVHKNLLLTANKDARMMLELDPNLKTPRGEALCIRNPEMRQAAQVFQDSILLAIQSSEEDGMSYDVFQAFSRKIESHVYRFYTNHEAFIDSLRTMTQELTSVTKDDFLEYQKTDEEKRTEFMLERLNGWPVFGWAICQSATLRIIFFVSTLVKGIWEETETENSTASAVPNNLYI